MKKFPFLFLTIALFGCLLSSCLGNDVSNWEEYKDWRNANIAWLEEMASKTNEDGTPYFKKVSRSWYPNAYVYMHYYNDTNLTRNNLTPLYTSTVDTKYIGYLYDGTPFDSSFLNTSPADSILRTTLDNVIVGWTVALSSMHVGDSCEVLIPFESAYGNTSNNIIKPYSALRFSIKLVDIPGYEIKPE